MRNQFRIYSKNALNAEEFYLVCTRPSSSTGVRTRGRTTGGIQANDGVRHRNYDFSQKRSNRFATSTASL